MPLQSTTSFQKCHLEEWAQTLGGLNVQRACLGQDKQWFWDLRPSNHNILRIGNHEN